MRQSELLGELDHRGGPIEVVKLLTRVFLVLFIARSGRMAEGSIVELYRFSRDNR